MVWPWGPGQAAVKGLCGWPLGGCSPLLWSCIYISALGLGLFLSCTAAVTLRILMRCAGSTPRLPCHHGFASQPLTWWLDQVFVTRPLSVTVGLHYLFIDSAPANLAISLSCQFSCPRRAPLSFCLPSYSCMNIQPKRHIPWYAKFSSPN